MAVDTSAHDCICIMAIGIHAVHSPCLGICIRELKSVFLLPGLAVLALEMNVPLVNMHDFSPPAGGTFLSLSCHPWLLRDLCE